MSKHRWKAGGGALTRLVILAALFVSAPAAAQPVDRWSSEVAEASARFGIPAEWIRRVIQAESDGRTAWLGQPIVSRAGAMGLMQLMPGTWRDMRAIHGLGTDPHDPHDNILAGTAYLRAMYDRFGYPGLFAAYNAGPARYAEHLANRRRLPTETVAYVAEVAGAGPTRFAAPVRRPAANMFVLLAGARPSHSAPIRPAVTSALFVPLSRTPASSDYAADSFKEEQRGRRGLAPTEQRRW